MIPDLPDELDPRTLHQRLDLLFEIDAIDSINLCCYL